MLIVVNPTAGQRRRRRLDKTLAALRARGIAFDLRETRRAGDATEIARTAARSGESLVIAGGGDGTVAEVVNGLLAESTGARGCALGILPLGTANVLAHELAVPPSATEFAELVARRHTRPMDPGVLAQGSSSRWFVQMVGAGFDAEVVRRVSMRLKRKVGGAAYAWQGIVEAGRYRFPALEVVIDGVPTTTHGIIVTKGRLYGGRYTLAPEASPLKPGFNVVLLDRPGAMTALACGMALPFGKMAKLPGVRLLPARHVRVEGAAPIQADGDSLGIGSFEVRSSPRPLDVLMH